MKGGGGGPGVALGPSPGPGLDQDREQDPTDEGPARSGRPPESSLPRRKSVEAAGDPGRAAGPVRRDGGTKEALGASKTARLAKAPPNARAGRRIRTGSRKRVAVKPTARAGIWAPAVARAGRTARVAAPEGSPAGAAGRNVGGGAQAAAEASTASRRRRPTAAGNPEPTSQVQGTIQGATRTAASTKTAVVAGERSPTPETICWTGQAGPRRPAGPSGGRCPRTFRIITPRGREEDQEAGADRTRSSRQQQVKRKNVLISIDPDKWKTASVQ